MAVGTIMPVPVFTGWDANGDPLAGGKLYTYAGGTTTPLTTYADASLTTPNTNPVILDAAGRATVFLTQALSYKFILKNAADVTVWSQDNILAVGAVPEPVPIVQTTTLSGVQHDFPLVPGCGLLRCNNAAALTFSGFAAGVDGQQVVVQSVAAGDVFLAHNSTGSVSTNRLLNWLTSGATPLAGGAVGGTATYVYDGASANWRLIEHNQGTWITVPYSAANFSASSGTWTVSAGSVAALQYLVVDKALTLSFWIQSTTLSSVGSDLRITLPGGYVVGALFGSFSGAYYVGGVYSQAPAFLNSGSSGLAFLSLRRDMGATTNWGSDGNFVIIGQVTIPIQ